MCASSESCMTISMSSCYAARSHVLSQAFTHATRDQPVSVPDPRSIFTSLSLGPEHSYGHYTCFCGLRFSFQFFHAFSPLTYITTTSNPFHQLGILIIFTFLSVSFFFAVPFSFLSLLVVRTATNIRALHIWKPNISTRLVLYNHCPCMLSFSFHSSKLSSSLVFLVMANSIKCLALCDTTTKMLLVT